MAALLYENMGTNRIHSGKGGFITWLIYLVLQQNDGVLIACIDWISQKPLSI